MPLILTVALTLIRSPLSTPNTFRKPGPHMMWIDRISLTGNSSSCVFSILPAKANTGKKRNSKIALTLILSSRHRQKVLNGHPVISPENLFAQKIEF
jgi:hypothetical protein